MKYFLVGLRQLPTNISQLRAAHIYLQWPTLGVIGTTVLATPLLIGLTPPALLVSTPAKAAAYSLARVTKGSRAAADTSSASQSHANSQTAAKPTTSPPQTANASAGANTATSSPSARTAANTAAPTSTHTIGCTSTGYNLPSAISTANQSEGLTKVIDAPTYYQVYGISVGELRNSIEACEARKAVGKYHASTAYQMNWTYSIAADTTGCRLSNVRVGLHVNQFMPLFVPDATTPAYTASSWNTYASGLKTHEDGHTAIDINYGEQLVAALQNIVNVPCASIASQAQTVIDSYVTMLDTANELYDSQTNHGTTQGAVL